MIAMQYNFTLPADYDMKVVDRRISEKGYLIEEFGNLKFKANLSEADARPCRGSSADKQTYDVGHVSVAGKN